MIQTLLKTHMLLAQVYGSNNYGAGTYGEGVPNAALSNTGENMWAILAISLVLIVAGAAMITIFFLRRKKQLDK